MQPIDSILAVADRYDTIVFDQWGVLHQGSAPYEHAVATIEALQNRGLQLCVLSNSGKRAGPNRDRITNMGFARDAFDIVMTSGEALAIDISAGHLSDIHCLFAITAADNDAGDWAKGLDITFTDSLADADAVLLMGLPDATEHPQQVQLLNSAQSMGKLLICSNPDRAAPRAAGQRVQSPGALAHAYADAGGDVIFYGKPHRPIFDTLFSEITAKTPARVLMVGDSPEHDIAGAVSAGWDSLFIAGGLHAGQGKTAFAPNPEPTYILSTLR